MWCVRRARLDRDRDGLLVFFVGVILFGAAAVGYFFTIFVVPASVGVVAKASIAAISRVAPHTMCGGVEGQWGGAGGAISEKEHLRGGGGAESLQLIATRPAKPVIEPSNRAKTTNRVPHTPLPAATYKSTCDFFYDSTAATQRLRSHAQFPNCHSIGRALNSSC